MEVERYLLSSALTGIVSQKLARRLCKHCRKTRPTTDYEKAVFKEILGKDVQEIQDVNGQCDNCRNGYYGRIAIQEVLLINDEIRNAINNKDISREKLRELVYTKNVTTLLQDGLEKVLEGITTFEEIYKNVAIDNELDEKYDSENDNFKANNEEQPSNEVIDTVNEPKIDIIENNEDVIDEPEDIIEAIENEETDDVI